MKIHKYLIILIISLFYMQIAAQNDENTKNEKINPEVSMKVLNNGLKVIIKQNEANDIFAAVCMINASLLYEESDKIGITNFVQNMLLKGTKKRSAEQIANTIESVGGNIDTSASSDYAEASVMSLTEDCKLSLELLSDILFNPSFPPEEIEKERKLILDNIKIAEDSSFNYTYKNFLKNLYAGHNYQYMPEGIPETINNIKIDDLTAYHKKYFIPSNMILSIVSRLNEDEVMQIVNKYFGQNSPEKPARMLVTKDFEIRAKSETLTKNIQQGFLTLGYITAPISSDDYPAIKVASSILGEGMSSRLFVELREKKGLAYAVGCIAPTKRDKGHFVGYIGTKPETLKASEEEMLRVFQEFADKEVSADELERNKNYIAGRFLMDHETNLRQAWYLGWFEIMGRGYAFDEEYVKAIRSVKAKDIMKIANKYFIAPTIVKLEPELTVEDKK